MNTLCTEHHLSYRRIYNAISLNAAVFAAVCLASLMDTALEGFILVSISFQLFAFSPKLNKVGVSMCVELALIAHHF